MAHGHTGGVKVADARDPIRCDLSRTTKVESWSDELAVERTGTTFVLVSAAATLTVGHGTHALAPASYAVVPGPAQVSGGRGLAITARDHRGLFHVGGPVERTGRLRYVDGCRDTVLVAPVVRGDPCLNLLHLPPGTQQTEHVHPSVRVGLVVEGRGTCIARGVHHALGPGTRFVLPACAPHRFETTADEGLLLMAWHPDSDTGPTDDDHPMLNRTLEPTTGERLR